MTAEEYYEQTGGSDSIWKEDCIELMEAYANQKVLEASENTVTKEQHKEGVVKAYTDGQRSTYGLLDSHEAPKAEQYYNENHKQ